MLTKNIHRSDTRGAADHGWLQARHSFSFADYYDPERVNFGALRVINDDIIQGGGGFGTHPHKDMEIISIPLEGALRHKDNMGHESAITSGEVQVMSAGTGVAHSEFNDSQDNPVNLLQIWVIPREQGLKPNYDQKKFNSEERQDKFQLIVSNDGREGSLCINQDAFFSMAELSAGTKLNYDLKQAGNGLYLFVINGSIEVEGEVLGLRDAMALTGYEQYQVVSRSLAKILVLEVPLGV